MNYDYYPTPDANVYQLVDVSNSDNPVLFVHGSQEQAEDCANALNATAAAPDLAALTDRILNALQHQGLTTWGCLSIEDAKACRAEAYAVVLDILKDATP